MRQFYLTYEKCQTVSGKLSWSHYCALLALSDSDKRSFYEKEAVNSNWSVRELKRKMESSLFERLLLSRGDANKEQVLELGRGFMFVGTQQRVTFANHHYYVDMVFYNKILRSYVLIELKTTKLMPEAVGQLNMYLNYYEAEVNEPGDNPPIGIILCTDKDNVSAEYALGGLSNNIFASTYTYVIPEKEKLIAQVEAVLSKWDEDSEE